MPFQWRDGDTVLTYGDRRLWPPSAMRYFSRFYLYPEMDEYSQWRWEGRFHGFPVPKHVLTYLPVGDGKELFEFTFPRAKWSPLEAVTNSDRLYTVHRYSPWTSEIARLYPSAPLTLNRARMLETALHFEGTWYDVGDLRRMQIARDQDWRRFHGRASRWWVCSGGSGLLHRDGGAILLDEVHKPVTRLLPDQLDPAFYLAHMLTSWRMIWKQPLSFGG